MQRVTTALALLAIVVANLIYAPSMWRRMQRPGERFTHRDLVIVTALTGGLLTGAALVFWLMLNPRR
jgi:hypothetical protein